MIGQAAPIDLRCIEAETVRIVVVGGGRGIGGIGGGGGGASASSGAGAGAALHDGEVVELEVVERRVALLRLHAGAVYLHAGRSYVAST